MTTQPCSIDMKRPQRQGGNNVSRTDLITPECLGPRLGPLLQAPADALRGFFRGSVRMRHFSPPWSVDEATESFCICDAKGQALADVRDLWFFGTYPNARAVQGHRRDGKNVQWLLALLRHAQTRFRICRRRKAAKCSRICEATACAVFCGLIDPPALFCASPRMLPIIS